jgi:hypothetical protein
MADESGEDDEPATVVGRVDTARGAQAQAKATPVESPTRAFQAPRLETTRAMPSGYGASRFIPPPRASSPRPAAGRRAGAPSVPSMVEDPTSASDMTLIELIDAEVDATTARFAVPDDVDPSILDEPSTGGSEATVQMSIPDDIPRNLLDTPTDPEIPVAPPSSPAVPPSLARAVPMAAPSRSSMPTPALGVTSEPPPASVSAPPSKPLAEKQSPDADRDRAARAPAPSWVATYIALCVVLGLLGAGALAYLKVERHW